MDRDAAVIIIKGRLQRANDTALDSKVITEMQEMQKELEGEAQLPWFLLSRFLSRSTTVGEERITLPTKGGTPPNDIEGDFLREYEGGSLWILNDAGDDYDPLEKDSFESLEATHGSLAQGKPKGYSLDGKIFRLKPVPDKVYTIRMRVWLRDATLDTNIENDWLKYASDLLIAKTGYTIAQFHLRDALQAKAFATEVTNAKARLDVSVAARQHTNRDYIMGDAD